MGADRPILWRFPGPGDEGDSLPLEGKKAVPFRPLPQDHHSHDRSCLRVNMCRMNRSQP